MRGENPVLSLEQLEAHGRAGRMGCVAAKRLVGGACVSRLK